jgi:anti-sigma-K factor RskA
LGEDQEPERASREARGRGRLGPQAMSRDPEEERFARGDGRRYSGWSSAFVIVAILVVLAIVILVYQLKH